ncbi:MAG: electron transport complex subunit RsxC [Gammaproteobacteria bacterium]|nr:electron transport complex subunit RsxC [Gammaproteobacteria bacterium]MDH5802945.1 electron transport complex subunit RsxC [Gammaproteobacteria bacterium]
MANNTIHIKQQTDTIVRRSSFRGLHLDDAKLTAHLSIKRLAFAPLLILPLRQHIGKPSIAVVKTDEEVSRGQLLARADGFLSTCLHAPVSGVVKKFDWVPSAAGMTPGMYLQATPGATQEVIPGTPCHLDTAGAEDIIQAIQNAGIVGLGGAAFPTHAKLKPPEGKVVDTLVVNGAECEPYLTTDHRVMLEQTDDIVNGILYCLKASGARQAMIGIESNKTDAAKSLNQTLSRRNLHARISVHLLPVKYPQGADKLLIHSLLQRTVPSGGHAYDIGAVTVNVATAAEIGHLLPLGQGIQERVITVSGPAVLKPGNYRITIGTPLRFILETLGVKDSLSRVFLGGPMMGKAVAGLDIPITKGVSSVLAFDAEHVKDQRKVYPCIHCGHCVEVCPMGLNPSQLGLQAKQQAYQDMAAYHLTDCFECGACAYVCPSHIPLTQYFRVAKAALTKLNRKAKPQTPASGEL